MFDELAKGARAARVLPAVKGMPEWFSPLVSRIEREGVDLTAQAKKTQKLEYEKRPISNAKDFEIIQSRKIEVPVAGKKEPDIITMTEYKNGDFYIESNTYGGAFDSPVELYYSSPKEVTEIQNIRDKNGNLRKTEVKVKKEGEFKVIEDRPYNAARYPFDDAIELERSEVSLNESISDLERIEKIATGKRIHPKKVQEREAARKYVEENPMDDVVNRYGDAEDFAYDVWKDSQD
jgi:hypothetical protein